MPRIIFLLGICPLCLCKKPLKGFWLFFFFLRLIFHFFPLITRSFPDHFFCRGGSECRWEPWAAAEQRVLLPVAWVLLELLTPLPVSANANPCPSLSASPVGLHYHLLSCFSTPKGFPAPQPPTSPGLCTSWVGAASDLGTAQAPACWRYKGTPVPLLMGALLWASGLGTLHHEGVWSL